MNDFSGNNCVTVKRLVALNKFCQEG